MNNIRRAWRGANCRHRLRKRSDSENIMMKFAAPVALLIASTAFVVSSTAGSDDAVRVDPSVTSTVSPQMNVEVPDLTNRQVIAAIKGLSAQLAQQRELLLQVSSQQEALQKELDDRSTAQEGKLQSIDQRVWVACRYAFAAADYAELIKRGDPSGVHTRYLREIGPGDCDKNRL